eukprot:SAG31_NODE_9424_length_1278_cov_3.614928_1_plen_351_part_00
MLLSVVFVQLFEKYGTLIERNMALIEKVSPCSLWQLRCSRCRTRPTSRGGGADCPHRPCCCLRDAISTTPALVLHISIAPSQVTRRAPGAAVCHAAVPTALCSAQLTTRSSSAPKCALELNARALWCNGLRSHRDSLLSDPHTMAQLSTNNPQLVRCCWHGLGGDCTVFLRPALAMPFSCVQRWAQENNTIVGVAGLASAAATLFLDQWSICQMHRRTAPHIVLPAHAATLQADAVRNPDFSVFTDLIAKMDAAKHAQDAEKRAMEKRLAANPFDTEAQAKIEDIIRQENVHRNFETAMEVRCIASWRCLPAVAVSTFTVRHLWWRRSITQKFSAASRCCTWTAKSTGRR